MHSIHYSLHTVCFGAYLNSHNDCGYNISSYSMPPGRVCTVPISYTIKTLRRLCSQYYMIGTGTTRRACRIALQKHANLRCSSHHFHSLVTSRERDGKKVQLVQAHSEFLSPLGA